MPLWNLPKGIDVELYNNMVDGFKYFQTQIAMTKKSYTSGHSSTKIDIIDSRDKEGSGTDESTTPPVANIKSILNKVDNQDKCEEIEELKQLPSLFRINTSHIRNSNHNNYNSERRDSVASLISVLSAADDKRYPLTPALKDEYSIFSPYVEDLRYQNKNPYAIFQHQKHEEKKPHIEKTPNSMSSSESFPDIPWDQLISTLTGVDKDMTLSNNGYKKIRTLCKTLQGELIEVIKINGNNIGKHFTIKITNKQLWKEHISLPDEHGLKYCIEDDICKESLILKHLTNDNKCSGQYIIKYIGFFESKKDYYLITEYINNCMNLKTFVKKCFTCIRKGELELKEYQHFVRYLMWQLCSTMQWMHEDMHCCHLKLCLDNLLLQNAQFIQKKDGKLGINPLIAMKLTDFGKSEIFKSEKLTDLINPFECQKPFLLFNDIQYVAPNAYDGDIYNAKKADIWSIGMIIWECYCGVPLYTKRSFDKRKEHAGSGYWSLKNKKLASYIVINNLSKYVNNLKILSLLNGLLQINEKNRYNALQLLKHPYFKCYYKHYKQRIIKKSIQQKKSLLLQAEKMEKISYYSF